MGSKIYILLILVEAFYVSMKSYSPNGLPVESVASVGVSSFDEIQYTRLKLVVLARFSKFSRRKSSKDKMRNRANELSLRINYGISFHC